MRHDQPVSKEVQATMAAKAEEARGLLDMIRPLCKKAMAGKLTRAEFDVFETTISRVSHVIGNAQRVLWVFEGIIEPDVVDPVTVKEAATNGKSVMVRKEK